MVRYGLIISCEEYNEFDDIAFCHSDAFLMFETLTNFCDYNKENLQLELLYRDQTELSPDYIYSKISELISIAQAEDTVMFYFAGHGMKINNTGYLILPNTRHDNIENSSLSLTTINKLLSTGKSNSFIILDACHSGIMSRGITPNLFVEPFMDIGCVTFASCSENEFSYPDEKLEQGIFTYNLCEVIKGWTVDEPIMIETLKLTVCENIKKWGEENYKRQTPTLHGNLVGNISVATRSEKIYEYSIFEKRKEQEENMANIVSLGNGSKQDNAVALWQGNEGVRLPKIADLSTMLSYNYQLKEREITGISLNYSSGLFEIAAETIWNRSIDILRDRVLALGVQFVSEMVGLDNLQYVQNLPAFEVINIAMDLGFIDATGKMRLMHANEIIQHYIKRNTDEEMPQNESDSVIRPCIQYILAYEDSNIQIEYTDFRNSLIMESILDNPVRLESLKNSPYFYKKTTIRTMINLISTTENAEFEMVEANFCAIIESIWDTLTSEDRYFIGLAFSKHKNAGNSKEVRALNTALLLVKGFDYVPENLRSLSFIENAKRIKAIHYGLNNYYNEPSAVAKLNQMGLKIPKPAMKECIGATLMVLLGNQYGRSFDAIGPATEILNKLSMQDWLFYIEHCLVVDEEVLSKIASGGNRTEHWCNITRDFNLSSLEFSNVKIAEFIKYSSSIDINNSRACAAFYMKKLF